MRYKTLFRLLLKLLGVWLVVTGIGATIQQVGWIIDTLNPPARMNIYLSWGTYLRTFAGVFEIIVGLYFFRDGAWIVNRAIPSNRPYCAECGYDLTGNTTGTCPECGLRRVDTSAAQAGAGQRPSDRI